MSIVADLRAIPQSLLFWVSHWGLLFGCPTRVSVNLGALLGSFIWVPCNNLANLGAPSGSLYNLGALRAPLPIWVTQKDTPGVTPVAGPGCFGCFTPKSHESHPCGGTRRFQDPKILPPPPLNSSARANCTKLMGECAGGEIKGKKRVMAIRAAINQN